MSQDTMSAEEEAKKAFDEGNKLAEAGDYAGALAAFDRAIKLNPDFPEAWVERAIALVNLGRAPEAVKSCNQALKYKRNLFDARLWRGHALFELGLLRSKPRELEQALKSYDQALKIEPVSPWALYGRAVTLFFLRRYQEAVENFEEVLEIDPNWEDIVGGWGGKREALVRLEEWLKKRLPPEPLWELQKLVLASEARLHLFIRRRLQEALGKEEEKWWGEGVPLPIRQKCAQRREESLLRRRQELYILTDLIDLKEILDKNWRHFEPDFQQIKVEGQVGSKKDFLDSLVRFNEIRNTVFHVRGVFHPPTEDDFKFARQMRGVIESFTPSG